MMDELAGVNKDVEALTKLYDRTQDHAVYQLLKERVLLKQRLEDRHTADEET